MTYYLIFCKQNGTDRHGVLNMTTDEYLRYISSLLKTHKHFASCLAKRVSGGTLSWIACWPISLVDTSSADQPLRCRCNASHVSTIARSLQNLPCGSDFHSMELPVRADQRLPSMVVDWRCQLIGGSGSVVLALGKRRWDSLQLSPRSAYPSQLCGCHGLTDWRCDTFRRSSLWNRSAEH
jgi:hypothetical protein